MTRKDGYNISYPDISIPEITTRIHNLFFSKEEILEKYFLKLELE
jgi:hypothetical protein